MSTQVKEPIKVLLNKTNLLKEVAIMQKMILPTMVNGKMKKDTESVLLNTLTAKPLLASSEKIKSTEKVLYSMRIT